MTNKEKQKIVIFAREAFTKFYADNYKFLSEAKYKPGKKTYRNLTSLNKMMHLFSNTTEDYIIKANAILSTGWSGSSSYVQHERVITNFELSDTSWEDRDRAVLLLNDNGTKLRNKYRKFKLDNPTIKLMEYTELPEFARKYLISALKNTDSTNMTLWKNTVITALFLYCQLGYLPNYSNSSVIPTEKEKRALISCCNYTKDNDLMDVTYIQQPIAMLRNLKLIGNDKKLTNEGYKLLRDMKMFTEVDSSIRDYEDVLGEDIEEVEEILNSKVTLEKADAPERKKRKSRVITSSTGAKNHDFNKSNKENKLTGDLGEKLVLDYEKGKLKALGITDIEDKVFTTTSRKEEYGNAYPCDIISYDPATGSKVFIEVKTTKGNAETPFFISREEVQFSADNENDYKLYRVYQALSNGKPKFYETLGKVEDNFSLEEDRYIATRYLND